MDAVLNELKDETAYWICSQLERNHYDGDFYTHMVNFVKHNKENLEDKLTQSPFWLYSMEYRDRYSYTSMGRCEDINKTVRYDYGVAFNFRLITQDEYNKHSYQIRQMMWREAQREKLLALYGKVPIDVLNEMLTIMFI